MRPQPPATLLEPVAQPLFAPAPDLREWVNETFIAEEAELVNEDHAHLRQAEIGFLWTNVENTKRHRTILGQCQLVNESGDKWSGGRSLMQLREWFGWVPDFLITLWAPAAADMDDPEFMSLVEHELYHAAQDVDAFGSPKFDRSGYPVFAMKSHDVEEFVGVVARYGMTGANVARMVAAANAGPQIREARIASVCGSCLRLVS